MTRKSHGTIMRTCILFVGIGMAKLLNRSTMVIFLLVCFSFASHAQWIPQPVPPDVSLLLSVDMSSLEVGVASGWFSGFSGRAINTSDGGTTWNLAQVPDSSRSLVSVQLFESGLGYIAGAYNSSLPAKKDQPNRESLIHGDPAASARVDYLQRIGMTGGDSYRGLFLRSEDHGERWSTWGVLPDDTDYLIGVSFVHPDTGWVTASTNNESEAEILRTTDGGLNWTAAGISDSIVSLPSIRFFNSTSGVAVGWQMNDGIYSGVILRTTNGGTTWEQLDFAQLFGFTSASVSDSATAYASGFDEYGFPVVYKTTNTGADWFPLAFPPSDAFLQGVCVANGTGTAVAYGSDYTPSPYVAYTTDGGPDWSPATLPFIVPKIATLNGGVLLDEDNGYLVGWSDDGALVLHTTNGGLTGHFPLETGNLWQLREDLFNSLLETEVTGDTTFPNGEIYSIVDGDGIGLGGRYVRQEGSRVMSFDTYDSTETVIYDFVAEVGDTIGDDPDFPIILESKRVTEFFGRQLTQWTFGVSFVVWVTVLDSIGLYGVAEEPGIFIYDFQGAIINGVQYGIITDIFNDPTGPTKIQLSQNYPNPFNPSTTIRFSLPRSSEISLKIFNLLGEEVVTLVSGNRDAGTHTVEWDATGQPSGVYFYRLRAGDFTQTKKLVLLR